ncbi:MAG: fatty acid desaturase [Rhodospirillales bacterium]|nr:fatty acid desaturase [Rhodospirillales bacterium]MCB9995408.1 fatty acid desaturase [Rhodospirillales bacterium]
MATALPADDTVKALVKDLTRHCREYKQADPGRAAFQLFVTILPFFALSAFMIWGMAQGIYWPLLGVIPAGGLLVRLFIVQHDCGHGSYFPSKAANEWTGRVLSVFTWTPYDFWRRAHNMHHASSGNLDKRGIGSIDTLTRREYEALPPRGQLMYRLYRNPFLLLVLGTPAYVMVGQRFLHGSGSPFIDSYNGLAGRSEWKSIIGLDVALAVIYGALVMAFGWGVLVLLLLPVVIAAWAGGWLFFIQHQFEDAYWEAGGQWEFHEAAVLGSSYYALPKVLQWFTGNIGLHHIHHLCSAVPNYRLQECLDAHDALQTLNRMTFRDSLQCVRWALWDEGARKMIGFRELRAAG